MENNLTLRFRLGNIPVVIEPWFWVMALVMGSNLRGPDILLWVGVVFVSILVHELGHAVASRAFGARAWIRLHSFGGLTYPDRKLKRSHEILMTLAGPFAGFALAGLVYGALWQFPWLALSPKAGTLLSLAFSVNFWWGIINLLPVPPLDGGHVALALAGPRNERSVRIFATIVAGLIVAWSLSEGSIYRAVLFGMLGYQNLQLVTRTARA
jgi:stage IV sporulation protein FB